MSKGCWAVIVANRGTLKKDKASIHLPEKSFTPSYSLETGNFQVAENHSQQVLADALR